MSVQHEFRYLPMRVVVRLITLIAVVGCAAGGSHADCDWEGFRTVNRTEWNDALGRCSPDEQVEIYLRSVFSTMPSNYDLVDAVAAQGMAIVPALVDRIERSENLEDELHKPELLFVLVRMQSGQHYEVSSDEKLMARLESTVASMTEPELKKAAEQNLGWLREPNEIGKAR